MNTTQQSMGLGLSNKRQVSKLFESENRNPAPAERTIREVYPKLIINPEYALAGLES